MFWYWSVYWMCKGCMKFANQIDLVIYQTVKDTWFGATGSVTVFNSLNVYKTVGQEILKHCSNNGNYYGPQITWSFDMVVTKRYFNGQWFFDLWKTAFLIKARFIYLYYRVHLYLYKFYKNIFTYSNFLQSEIFTLQCIQQANSPAIAVCYFLLVQYQCHIICMNTFWNEPCIDKSSIVQYSKDVSYLVTHLYNAHAFQLQQSLTT